MASTYCIIIFISLMRVKIILPGMKPAWPFVLLTLLVDTPGSLEIVPVRVVRFSQPKIRRDNALNATALPPHHHFHASAHLWDAPRPVPLCAFHNARLELYACMCTGSLRSPLFALLDDLVLAMIRGGNAVGGADSSVVGGMGVVSTRSSFSRSAESDDIVVRDEESAWSLYYVGWRLGRHWALRDRRGNFGAAAALTARA